MTSAGSAFQKITRATLPAVGTAGYCLAAAASLAAFPSVLPWIIALWLAWHSWRVARLRSGWLPLVTVVLVLIAMWMHGGHLSDDGLHPNAAGNRELAQAVAKALSRVFGDAILSQPDSRR